MDGESLRRLRARFEPHYLTTLSLEKKKDPKPTQPTPQKVGQKPARRSSEKPPLEQAAVYKALWKMAEKNAKLYREVMVAKKKEVAAAKVVAKNALKKADDWEKKAVKAEKALEDVKKALNVVVDGQRGI